MDDRKEDERRSPLSIDDLWRVLRLLVRRQQAQGMREGEVYRLTIDLHGLQEADAVGVGVAFGFSESRSSDRGVTWAKMPDRVHELASSKMPGGEL